MSNEILTPTRISCCWQTRDALYHGDCAAGCSVW